MKLLELTDKDYTQIETLSGCSYSPEKIAMYLMVDEKEFLEQWNTPKSKIRYHYDRGVLLTQAKSDIALVESSNGGNITAYQQVLKNQYFQKIDNAKKKIQLNAEIKDIDYLKKYFEDNDISGLPEEKVRLYEVMNFVRQMHDKGESKNFIINNLLSAFPHEIAGRSKAVKIYTESLNFFKCDDNLKKAAIYNIAADKLEDAAMIAFELNDLDQYRLLWREITDYRIKAAADDQFPKEVYRKPNIIYVMDPRLVGGEREDRKLVAKFINSLIDVSDEQKKDLHRDNLTEDVEFEIIPTPDEDKN